MVRAGADIVIAIRAVGARNSKCLKRKIASSGSRTISASESQSRSDSIDEARASLETQQNRNNREIIRELKASADRIFDLLNKLEEI